METETETARASKADEGVPLVVGGGRGGPARGQAAGCWARAGQLARRRLPALRWLPAYSRQQALGDAVAGLTLGLTLVPQSIAYAALAGIPVQRGLYSALAGGLVYVPLGSVRQVSIGPTSLMALLTLQATHARRLPLAYVPLLALLSGLIVLAMGLLRLGFLVDLISPAVTGGFTSGTAIIVAVAQFKGLLGLSFVAESVPENLLMIARHAADVRAPDCLLSLVCCVVLLLLRKLKDLKVSEKRRVVRKALWLVSIARNALVVGGAALLAYATSSSAEEKHRWFTLSGRVEAGLPSWQWPAPLQMPAAGDAEGSVSLLEAVQQLGGMVLLMPVVMVLANIAIAKTFSVGRVDATQEMVALGMCNVVGACLQAMPTCGAFTRSALAHSSGVRTPMAGLYSGAITLLALVFLTEYFYFIPRASLSSVLVCAVIFMVDVSEPRKLWSRGERMEALIWAATFVASLTLGVEAALVLGALLSLGALLRRLGRDRRAPTVHQCASAGAVVVVFAPPALVYVNAARWAGRALAALGAAAPAQPRVLLVDCARLALVDDAATQELELLGRQLRERGVRLAAFKAHEAVARRLRRVGALAEGAGAGALGALGACSLEAALAPAAAPPARPAMDDAVPMVCIGPSGDPRHDQP